MVLWEITLATAYFLGLKRTYRLALRIQRRLVSPRRPKIRQFLHRRTRTVFDAALKVHLNIQKRDIEVGRNLGNWILRWLDRMKPSAQIRSPSPMKPSNGANSNVNMKRQATGPGSIQASRNQDSSRHLFTASRNTWTKTLPTISMMMRPPRPTGMVTQYRHLCIRGPEMASANYIGGVRGFEGVVRKDIMQYLLQK